jgi:hypothetical protein
MLKHRFIENRLCACGCKKFIPVYSDHMNRKFVNGHNWKGVKKPPRSEEYRNNIRLAHLGKKRSISFCKRMSEVLTGKHLTEETKKKISESHKGPKCHFWKGGKTNLGTQIRHLFEMKKWRTEVFNRDNYTCKECGNRGGDLHPHHIKRFSDIFTEFLQTYSQFSPIDDIETLVRLALTYKDFWDVENGKTLCRDCHELTFKFK